MTAGQKLPPAPHVKRTLPSEKGKGSSTLIHCGNGNTLGERNSSCLEPKTKRCRDPQRQLAFASLSRNTAESCI